MATERSLHEAGRAEQTAAPIAGSAAMAAPESHRDAPAGTSSLARDEGATGSGDSSVEASARQDPDAWLERIEASQDSGRTAEADAEFERFRQAFPDRALHDPGVAPE